MRLGATRNGSVLRHFFIAYYCPFKVSIRHIDIVSHRHRLSVAKPLCNNVQGILASQICLIACPHGMPQACRTLESSATNDLFQRRPQVRIRPPARPLGPLAIFFGEYDAPVEALGKKKPGADSMRVNFGPGFLVLRLGFRQQLWGTG
ncbi:hypothetical protein ETAA8_58760 [Anatilimnocola aggregata]|uniref:Uncharacterized protein n=1 Tax=Anatilimnocola aggregata TaxID=2528021 RepID=A0A517YKI6_9BACT|nr:hypothetical protein ETAA8_58760 [Anatilimnocola aggregata]